MKTNSGFSKISFKSQVCGTAILMLSLFGGAFGYTLYYGNLHSHTCYSLDWAGAPGDDPERAYAYARDTAHIQVLAVTDHNYWLDPSEWADTKTQAHAATIPGTFVGLAAFEWTSWPALSDINVFYTDDYYPDTNVTMPFVYSWLHDRPAALGQFDHPYEGGGFFDDFRYSDTGDARMAFWEMQRSFQGDSFHVILDSGWHVGLSANQDNHHPDWGSLNQLTGIWADSLAEGSVYSALKCMRTFGTLDRDFRLQFTVNDSWMGSAVPNGQLHFRVVASDSDVNDNIERVDILTNHGVSLRSLVIGDTNAVSWEFDTTTNQGERRYFYVRVIQTDGDYAVSSPIWTPDLSGIADAEQTRRVAESALRVAPNPFLGATHVPGRERETFVLYDETGRPTTRCRGDAVGRGLPAGVYFLRQATGQGTARIVKLH